MRIDHFSKNIILVFATTSVLNFFNLLYQLFIAHKFSPADFAGFNTLLAIFTLVSTPLLTLQIGVVKYTAEFNAHQQVGKIKSFLSCVLNKVILASLLFMLLFLLISPFIMRNLKISSAYSGYTLSFLIASACIVPVFTGSIQGLEMFKWFASISALASLAKMSFILIIIWFGLNIAGALSGFLIANVLTIFLSIFAIKHFLTLQPQREDIDYKGFLAYLMPVAINSFCFMGLVNLDLILVKYFFRPQEAGLYSLAGMIGKLFLFLPSGIFIVMFPRTSHLNAKQIPTRPVLKKSLYFTAILCLVAIIIYNAFPGFLLKLFTGKAYPESIYLGRLFSISMSFFALTMILSGYFLSVNDLRFIKYLAVFTFVEFLSIAVFHKSLNQVQLILCLVAILSFLANLILLLKKDK